MNLRRSLPRKLLLALLALAAAQGCDDVAVTAVEVASVVVAPDEGKLFPDETLQLSATPRSLGGEPLSGRDVAWTSEDGNVASVSPHGLVTAREPGETRIVATSGGVSGSATVVVRARPTIDVTPTELRFEGLAGNEDDLVQTFEIRSGGETSMTGLNATVAYESGGATGWLEVALDDPEAPTTAVATASARDLQEGLHRASIRIEAPGAENGAVVVAVEFEVAPAPPAIALSSAGVGFVSEEGQPEPPDQEVTVTNAGEGELTGLTVSIQHLPGQGSGWLSADLESSTAPTSLRLGVSPGSLEAGTYDAHVWVDAPVAAHGPERVRVRLTVGSPPPEIGLVPDQVFLSITEGTAAPPTGTVEVENRGTGELGGLTTSISFGAGGPAGWLQAALDGTTAPADMTLSLVDTDLLPGEYSAAVEVASPDAVNSPRTLDLALEVLPRASPLESELDVQPDAITADGASTAQVEVILRDARGDRMPFGGNSVSLSASAGSLGPVTDHGDGRYTSTLTAATSTGTATIAGTVDATAIADSAEVTFVAGAPSAAHSTAVVPDGTAGEPTTISITVRDASGNPVAGQASALAVSVSGANSASPAVTDVGGGDYTATYTPTHAGTDEVVITLDDTPIDGSPFESTVAESGGAGEADDV